MEQIRTREEFLRKFEAAKQRKRKIVVSVSALPYFSLA